MYFCDVTIMDLVNLLIDDAKPNMKINIFTRLIKGLGIPYTQGYTESLYQSNPYKYTLFGLSKMLSLYSVDNVCAKLGDKNELFDLSAPFIAHLADDFVIVKSVDKERVLYEWYGEDIIMSVNDFMQAWSGVVLLAYPDENSIEPDYKKHKIAEFIHRGKYALAGLAASFLFIYSFCWMDVGSDASSLFFFTVGTITNVFGLYVSYLLIQKQLHIQSRIADSICNVLKKSSCNNVLESSAAKLFGTFGWSEFGAAYFLVNLVAIAIAPQCYSSMMWLSILSMGYVVWSVWYQRFKAHAWCPLCLLVQAVFVVQCVGYVLICFLTDRYFELPSLNMFPLFAGYAMALLVLNLLLPTFVSAQKAKQLQFSFNNLKAQEKVFQALQAEQELHSTDDASSLFFGSEDAEMKVTVFSNPYCNPCAAMHKRLEALKNKSCRIQYVLTYFSEDLSDINRYLIAAYQTLGVEKAWEILSNWFKGGKSEQERFFAPMNLNIDAEEVNAEFERHKAWRDETNFNATPTVLVNGQKLAYPYQLEDLQMFIE